MMPDPQPDQSSSPGPFLLLSPPHLTVLGSTYQSHPVPFVVHLFQTTLLEVQARDVV